jgi:hypothetical protein
MSEPNTTADFMQRRLADLERENATLKMENKDRRIKYKKASEELEQLKGQVGTLTTERDTYKDKAEQLPQDLTGKIADLEGQIRSRDHRDAFASVGEFEVPGEDGKARKYRLADGVKPDAVWQLSGYKAEGATPDAKAVSAKYGEVLQAHPFLFAEVSDAPGGATRPIAVQAREGGPGAGKGTNSPTVTAAAGGKVVTTAPAIPGRF